MHKTALNRMAKEMGRLSRSAKGRLIRSGAVRTRQQMANGIVKGNENLANKLRDKGYGVVFDSAVGNSGHTYTRKGDNGKLNYIIESGASKSGKNRYRNAMTQRHEINEARASVDKFEGKYKKDTLGDTPSKIIQTRKITTTFPKLKSPEDVRKYNHNRKMHNAAAINTVIGAGNKFVRGSKIGKTEDVVNRFRQLRKIDDESGFISGQFSRGRLGKAPVNKWDYKVRISNHNNLGVIARESNMLSTVPYETAVTKYRKNKTREAAHYRYVTGKEYGVDRVNHSKLMKQKVPEEYNTVKANKVTLSEEKPFVGKSYNEFF